MAPKIADTGLSIIYEPEDIDPIADLVFVHGLQGHPYLTWVSKASEPANLPKDQTTAKGDMKQKSSLRARWRKLIRKRPGIVHEDSFNDVFWPLDLLSKSMTCSQCRILTWGYETSVTARPAKLVNKNNIYSHAKDLYFALGRSRYKTVPIVFVAHSLGGLLVKEVLALSDGTKSPHPHEIVDRTAAIVFLGTPHRGGGHYADLGEVARKVVSALGIDTNPTILDSLGLRNSDLERAQDSFSMIWRKYDFKVKTFQEGLPLTILNIRGTALNETVVPKFSSLLGDIREEAETLNANHMNMARYGGMNDPNYIKVGDELERICKLIRTRDNDKYSEDVDCNQEITAHDLKNIRRTLYFPEMDIRCQTISNAMMGTCLWVQNVPAYQAWTSQRMDHKLLWIKGKPGSGKSTLMKFIVENAEMRPGDITASFFFNGRGADLERTAHGLLRSLVYQLLPFFPKNSTKLLKSYRKRLDAGTEICWQDEELKTYLKTILTQPRSNVGVVRLFVDGFDECSNLGARNLVYFFSDLLQSANLAGAHLTVCISSQSLLNISLPQYLTLVVEDYNDIDITQYVYNALSMFDNNLFWRGLKKKVIKKASGVFLWAVLVVEMLRKAWDDGQGSRYLSEQLEQTPPELSELFRRLLKGTEQDITLRFFQWIVFSLRTLKLSEWAHILPLIYNPSLKSLHDWKNSPQFIDTEEQLERRIRKMSQGLVEVKDLCLLPPGQELNEDGSLHAGAGSFASCKVVLPIHESVRSFFLYDDGFSLWNQTIGKSTRQDGDVFIMSCCLTYAELKEIRCLFDRKVGDTACPRKTNHIAEQNDLSPLYRRLGLFNWHNMSSRIVSTTPLPWASTSSSSSLPSHTAWPAQRRIPPSVNLSHFSQRLQQRKGSLISLGSSAGSDYVGSVRSDTSDYEQALLRQSLPTPNRPSTPFRNKLPSPSFTLTRTRMEDVEEIPMEENMARFFQWSNSSHSVEAHVSIKERPPTLSNDTVSTQQIDAIPGLLRYVSQMFDYHAWVADHLMADLSPIVERLLDRQFWEYWCSLQGEANSGMTLLSYAVDNRFSIWVQTILALDGVIPELALEIKHLAVIAASEGYNAMVELLLEKGASLHVRDDMLRSVLNISIDISDLAICDAVLQYVRPNDPILESEEGSGWTPLHQAAHSSSASIVQRLVREYTPNVRTHDQRTPLHLACERAAADEEICRLLLYAGADVTARSSGGFLPRDIAEKNGHSNLFDLLRDWEKAPEIFEPEE